MTTTDDSGSSPEAQAALAEARSRPAPTYPVSRADCQHPAEQVIVIGHGFDDTELAYTATRCEDCGTEFVTEETP